MIVKLSIALTVSILSVVLIGPRPWDNPGGLARSNAQLITPDFVQEYSYLYQFYQSPGDIGKVADSSRALAKFDGSALFERLMSTAGNSQEPCSQFVNGWLGTWGLNNSRCQNDVAQLACGLQTFAKAVSLQCSPTNHTCLGQKMAAIQTYNWTAYVLDASAAASSGLLEGNRLWLGTFRECYAIPSKLPSNGPKFTPKYCTISYSAATSRTKAFSNTCLRLNGMPPMGSMEPGCAQSERSVHNTYAMCVPGSCSTADISHMVVHFTKAIAKYSDICINEHYGVRCKDNKEPAFDSAAIAMIVILCLLTALLIAGTAYDVYSNDQIRKKVKAGLGGFVREGSQSFGSQHFKREANGSVRNSIVSLSAAVKLSEKDYYDQLGIGFKLLLAFSIMRNVHAILSPKKRKGHIACFDGFRVITNLWVILADSYFLLIPYIGNLGTVLRLPKDFGFQVIDNGSLSADSFFLLSGTLVAFLFFKEMDASGGSKLKSPKFWMWFYLHRIFRLVPVYMLILGATMLLPYTSTGPLWNTGSGSALDVDQCRESWWTNLLFINNFVGVDKPCMSWTWFLANEMQFYVVSPIFLVLLWGFPIVGFVFCLVIIGGCCILRGLIMSDNVYPPTLMFSLNPAFTANVSEYYTSVYVKPYMRCAPYVVGVLLGYLMFKTRAGIRLIKPFAWVSWLTSALLCLSVLLAPYSFAVGLKKFTVASIGLYGGVHRAVWAIGVAIVIFICAQGFGGSARRILSWRMWTPLARLSYVTYVVHPIVIGVFYMQTHRAFHIDHWMMFYYFCGHTILSYLTAFVICVSVERPITNVFEVLFPTQRSHIEKNDIYYYGHGWEKEGPLSRENLADKAIRDLNSIPLLDKEKEANMKM